MLSLNICIEAGSIPLAKILGSSITAIITVLSVDQASRANNPKKYGYSIGVRSFRLILIPVS
jgi:hypothetical protein